MIGSRILLLLALLQLIHGEWDETTSVWMVLFLCCVRFGILTPKETCLSSVRRIRVIS